jgi:hypothetical protein
MRAVFRGSILFATLNSTRVVLRSNTLRVAAFAGLVVVGAATVAAAPPDEQREAAQEPSHESPWLAVPIVSSSPKLGFAGGGLGGYMHTFDPQSRLSVFGAAFVYTSTESKVGAFFARTSFGQDHHRIDAVAVLGYIRNDYDNYLGTGQPLKTNDDAGALAGRYRYRLAGNWFVGGQAVSADYRVLGDSAMDDALLETLGVTGFNAVGIGVNVSHDSRDNQDMPTGGWFTNVNNFAFRESLGGGNSFDVYRVDVRAFLGHGRGHVFAVRQNNEFTSDAPVSGQATVWLRGYKQGEYLGKNMSSLEIEERLRLASRWGVNVFGGYAALYGGGGAAVSDTDAQFYSSFGTGLQFVLKPQQRLVANFELAYGNSDNAALYLKLGYAW